ncbi:hypothetical protein [Nocardioides hungaricus]
MESLAVEPRRARRLGEALLARLGDTAIEEILIWDDPDSAVLAHVVGAARDVPVVRAQELEGLVEAVDEQTAGTRVLVLAPQFRTTGSWRALTSLVELHQGRIAAIGAIADSPALAEARAAGHAVVVLHDHAEETA